MIDRAFWKGRRVFVTGHTGFKGAWLTLLLRSLGSDVVGYALAPDSPQGLFDLANVARDVDHNIGDVRNLAQLESVITAAKPSIVIHMAAQSLVRKSYSEPIETYATNVMGTAHVLDCLRRVQGVAAAVVVTSDKCYENVEEDRAYRETDPMGGYDPYSSSKGCAELVTAAYRRSFFGSSSEAQIASARAGNVIGGGDWSNDRLVPDLIRAFMAGKVVQIRSPNAIRPWQYVLDPLVGYLVLAQRLAGGQGNVAEGWNFGPGAESEVSVLHLVERMAALWSTGARWELDQTVHPHEASYLRLDCGKSHRQLGWRPLIGLRQALKMTCEWYLAFSDGRDMRDFSLRQIDDVMAWLDSSEKTRASG